MRLIMAKLRRPLTSDAPGDGEVMEVLQLQAPPPAASRRASPRQAMQGRFTSPCLPANAVL